MTTGSRLDRTGIGRARSRPPGHLADSIPRPLVLRGAAGRF